MKPLALVTTAFKIWTAIAYELGWFACILGAAHGWPWVGPAVVAVIVLAHLLIVPDRLREVWLLALCGIFGFGVDSFHGYVGVFAYPPAAGISWLAPPWLIAIWLVFGLTLHGCLAWLQGRYWLGVILGAVGGPLAYWAGERMGAMAFAPGLLRNLTIVGSVWAVATPVLLIFARLTQWDRNSREALQQR
jgi:hypothetical protein